MKLLKKIKRRGSKAFQCLIGATATSSDGKAFQCICRFSGVVATALGCYGMTGQEKGIFAFVTSVGLGSIASARLLSPKKLKIHKRNFRDNLKAKTKLDVPSTNIHS